MRPLACRLSRPWLAFSIIVVIGLGLASRKFLSFFPAVFGSHTGDALWALMIFLGIAFLKPRMDRPRLALAALAVAYLVEASQLYQDDWINDIRATTLGHLVLGTGFQWLDLLAYSVGIVVGYVGDWLTTRAKAVPAPVYAPWPVAASHPLAPVFEVWRNAELPFQPSAGLAAIESFQTKYGVVLPKDVRAYLLAVNGTGEDTDDYMSRFLSLNEIRPVHEELDDSGGVTYPDRYSYPDCFVFVDICMSESFYAVRLTADSTQAAPVFQVLCTDAPPRMMAATFRKFMLAYANDPGSIT